LLRNGKVVVMDRYWAPAASVSQAANSAFEPDSENANQFGSDCDTNDGNARFGLVQSIAFKGG